MGIRTVIIIVFGLAVASAQAGDTNSWKSGSSFFWDTDGDWSLNASPSISDCADFITNSATKTVTIDSFVAADTLTISNLTVAGIVGVSTNTLSLNNAGTNTPLHVLNAMMISNAAILQITNSVLQVDGSSGGMFVLTGSMRVLNKAKVQLNKAMFSNDSVLQFALGTNSSSVVVSNNLTLGGTLKVVDGGGLSNATYTLFTYGGTLSYNGLTVGAKPGSSICVVDTNTFGQVNLVVTLPPFQIISIVQSNNNVVVGWTTSGGGINFVQATAGDGSGGYSTTNFQDISGQILVGAGTTNTYTESGGAISGSSRFYRIRFPQ